MRQFVAKGVKGKASKEQMQAAVVAVTEGGESLRKTRFMRRVPSKVNNIVFVFPEEDDVCVHGIGDIVMKLPEPIQAGGTARCSKQFKFYCDKLKELGHELE